MVLSSITFVEDTSSNKDSSHSTTEQTEENNSAVNASNIPSQRKLNGVGNSATIIVTGQVGKTHANELSAVAAS